MTKIFVTYVIVVTIIFCFLIYYGYGLYRHKECENISFSTKSCERWRDF